MIVEFEDRFEVRPDDTVYLCGTNETIADYFRIFPGTRPSRPARHATADDDAEDRAAQAGGA